MKGKYAARAANRAAAFDNDVIADLRQQLADTKADNGKLVLKLNDETAANNGRIVRAVNEQVTAQTASIRAAIAAEREQMTARLNEAADEVVDVLVAQLDAIVNQFGDDVPSFSRALADPIDTDGPSLIRVFQLLAPDRAGELSESVITLQGRRSWSSRPRLVPGETRRRRRRSAAALNSDIQQNQRDRSKAVLVDGLKGKSG
jgi:hypothetical protein